MTTDDRTRAIAWFEKQSKCLTMPGAAKMFGLAAEALNAGRWIPVSERLPENGIDALLYWSNDAQNEKYVDIERYHIDHWETLDRPWIRAIAWMPLPEPPRKDDEA